MGRMHCAGAVSTIPDAKHGVAAGGHHPKGRIDGGCCHDLAAGGRSQVLQSGGCAAQGQGGPLTPHHDVCECPSQP
jgi:hypothetical protein